jgi:hypothetical protein
MWHKHNIEQNDGIVNMIITDIGIFYNNIIKLYMSGTAHNRIVNASLRSG